MILSSAVAGTGAGCDCCCQSGFAAKGPFPSDGQQGQTGWVFLFAASMLKSLNGKYRQLINVPEVEM